MIEVALVLAALVYLMIQSFIILVQLAWWILYTAVRICIIPIKRTIQLTKWGLKML